MSSTYQTLFTALEAATSIVERLASLPAVATIDWADEAASALVGVASGCHVCVMIASLDQAGAIVGQEAVGVATRGGGEEADHVLLNLRSRAERLSSIGFRPTEAALDRGVVSPIGRLTENTDWRIGALGQLWSGSGADDLMIGLVRLGQHEPGRVLFIQVGMVDGVRVSAEHVGLLRATLPMLQARALCAVGARRATTNRWLTQREQQVLRELTLGKSVRAIADDLGRSQHTVHDHVKSLHRKLGASSRGELVARALGHLAPSDGEESRAVAPGSVIFLLNEIEADAPVRIPAGKAPAIATPGGRPEVVVPDGTRAASM